MTRKNNGSVKKFDQAAADWDKNAQRVKLADDIASAIAELPLTREMTAMEYGCGTGLVGLALAPKLKSMTAVDTSPQMLAVLNKKIEDRSIPNVSTMLLPDPAKKFPPQKFDLIFCSMTLHHIKDTEQILKLFSDSINPGGYLAIADLDKENGGFHGDNAVGVEHNGFERPGLITALTQNELQNINVRTVHIVIKINGDGEKKYYPVFLITCVKL